MYSIAPLVLSTLLFLSVMERVNFDYSMKNIPLPNHSEYTKRLIEKTESVIKRMRWRAFFFLNPDKRSKEIETYGFNSRKTPPQLEQMTQFEDSLLQMIDNIQFRDNKCQFQSNLRKNVKEIRQSNHMYIPADKTNNYYKLEKHEYDKMLKDNTTAKYTRTSTPQIHTINQEAKQIAEKLQLSDRIEKIAEKPAFITIKDHKENFPNNIQCRLINPAKTEIGVISKKILDRINTDLIKTINVQQWKNTQSAIDWFKSINNKQTCTFLVFDIVEFYPSITQQLLEDALEFASAYTTITDTDKEIILHAKKTLLFHDNTPWHKSKPPHLFDVTMGSYDGAETCELVGTYILSKVKHLFNGEVGLYRDDGLAVLRNMSPSQSEKVAKELASAIKKHSLKITISHGMKTVNFLDTTLDLQENIFRPYTKPNNTSCYVNKKSNHPPNITKTIPKSVNKRLSSISSNAHQFDKSKQPYQKALDQAGYKHTLTYETTQNRQTTRTRNRNIIWFNPPFSKNVTTNVGKRFLQLIDKHFPKSNPLHKIFNRNKVKVSYSCMDSVGKIINAHNKSILQKDTKTPTKTCNCRIKKDCPLNGHCLTKCVVYKATVNTHTDTKSYIGACDTTFKERYSNHMSSFRLQHKKTQTALSKHIWHLKENNTEHSINWSVIKKTSSYSNISKRCPLCLWEKYFIITADKSTTLNNRTELISKCRHINKFLLDNT